VDAGVHITAFAAAKVNNGKRQPGPAVDPSITASRAPIPAAMA